MPPFTSCIESEYISIVTYIVLSLILGKSDWIRLDVGQNKCSYHGLDWVGSLSWWIGLDYILQDGSMFNSGPRWKQRGLSRSIASAVY